MVFVCSCRRLQEDVFVFSSRSVAWNYIMIYKCCAGVKFE